MDKNMANSLLYDTIVHYVPHLSIYFELVLTMMVVWIIFKKRVDSDESLTQEEQDKVDKFTPDKLVEDRSYLGDWAKLPPPAVQDGKYITLIYNDEDKHKCLNAATHNFLGFAKNPSIESATIKSVEKYGVGSCGPRGFYGTVDVHLELEEKLADYLGAEEAVVYSYGFSTMASAIPAYSKKNDIIFADKWVNYAIQKGIEASRSTVFYFNHNDMEHLESLLIREVEEKRNDKKRLKARKFIIAEAVYQKTGFICPIAELVNLRKKYKLRMILDESLSIGVLGKTGAGIREEYGIPGTDIDLIVGSLENSFGSIGGFCVGTSFIVEHQRLSGLGYCFSASLPPALTTAAIEALEIIKKNPELVATLKEKCLLWDKHLHASETIKKHFEIRGSDLSPIKILEYRSQPDELYDVTLNQLRNIYHRCDRNGVAFSMPCYLDDDHYRPPVIKIAVSVLHSETDIKSAVEALERSSLDHT